MAACCDAPKAPRLRLARRLLWIVLAINLVMFALEAAAGWHADSVALQADALDFLGDSLNYALALFVLARSLAWRSGSALLKGGVMLGFGLYVLGATLYNALAGAQPAAPVMGAVGALALVANLACAFLLFRFRGAESNLRAVWLCSRNDAFGNIAVLAAASGVALSETPWPDLGVGLAMAGLAVWSGLSVMRQARRELAAPQPAE